MKYICFFNRCFQTAVYFRCFCCLFLHFVVVVCFVLLLLVLFSCFTERATSCLVVSEKAGFFNGLYV